MTFESNPELPALPSTEPATQREIRPALLALLVSLLLFAATAPFAKLQLGAIPAFIPIYVSGLIICDLITAALLFAQFNALRSAMLLAISGAYLFSALSTLAYALIFPGLLPLNEWLPAGPQTSSAMYMCWHAGFPLMLIAYTRLRAQPSARLDPDEPPATRLRARVPILAMIGGVLAFVVANGVRHLGARAAADLPRRQPDHRYRPCLSHRHLAPVGPVPAGALARQAGRGAGSLATAGDVRLAVRPRAGRDPQQRPL